MLLGLLILEVFAKPLVGLFNLTDETASLCVLSVRIIAAGFLFAGGNIAIQGIFQALGCGMSSLVTSLLRLCVVVLPLAWLFTTLDNALSVIWFAFPIAELVALVVGVLLLIRADRKIVRVLK